MEALKRQRRAVRTVFTKTLNSFQAIVNAEDSIQKKLVEFDFLETKMGELDAIHAAYNKEVFKSEMSDSEILKELESDDGYKKQFLAAKAKVLELTKPAVQTDGAIQPLAMRRPMKLPSIELPKINGHVKEWLPFWSQFKKINDDVTISKEDKFVYLLRATVTGSKAHEIVSSFPPTSENYDKAVKKLKNRVGRDDIVVEFYVRELLQLVLQNAASAKGEKRPSLSSIYDKVETYIRALETLGVTTDKCAAMLYPLVESSLPEDVLRAWQRSGGQREVNDANGQPETKDRLTRLLEFLQFEVENEEHIEMALTGFGNSTEPESVKRTKGKVDKAREAPSASVLFVAKSGEKSVQCIFCKSSHESQDCDTARKMSLDDRRDAVKKENACFSCLKRGHTSQKCRVRVSCGWCSRRHVLLMCPGLLSKEKVREPKPDSRERVISENTLATFCETPSVCLQTLRIRLFSESKDKTVRAIVDTASQRSYIRTSVAKELGYVAIGKQEIAHSLFGGVRSGCEKHDMFLLRMRNLDNSYACNFSALNQDTICDTVPSVKNAEWVKELRDRGIHLSDIGQESSPIDLLIGADVAGKLITGKKLVLRNGIVALETSLGWTVIGKLPNKAGRNDAAVMITTMHVQEADLSELWRLDVVGITDPVEKVDKSLRDKQAQDFLRETALVTAAGRYEVRLPFKDNYAPISSNYDISRHRLKRTVEKLKAQNLFHAYDNIFNDWLSEGIIEVVSEAQATEFHHYLPHRPVVKSYGTTRIRPVFDASACRKGHPSLNQCLEKGPNLIELIPSVLNRFRENEIGVVSDIKKAFLQIGINELDRDFLRFFWVRNDEVKILRHCRVVFGLACSPFLLAAVIDVLLTAALEKTETEQHPAWSTETVETLRLAFYVDNCVTSVDSESDLNKFIREAKAIMAMGGFDLRGWENSGNFLEAETSLVLGLLWNKRTDTISINPAVLDISKPDTVTKRSMLSASHRIFDPVGFTCPVSLLPRKLLQELWAEKIDWDSTIDGKKEQAFRSWLSELSALKDIKVPRKLGRGSLTIHTFCDASGGAYAAAVFARIERDEIVSVHLMSARSRIAPRKATIARLELMAATIGVRLANAVVNSLTRKVQRMTYWTDSTTVLAWIKRDVQWGTFVFNRVKEIREFSSKDDWKYVPGKLNPADLPSRGCAPSQLVQSRWWLGPEWLRKAEVEWPVLPSESDEEEIHREAKRTSTVDMISVDNTKFTFGDYFSSYKNLIRFVAWTHKFVNNCRTRARIRKASGSKQIRGENCNQTAYKANEGSIALRLTVEEVELAETRLLGFLQEVMFGGKAKEKLSPFKTSRDRSGLIVLRTKIFNRRDDFRFLCPILLDSKHESVYLLVRETHEILGHAGTLVVMSTLREKFWIISLRKVVKGIISRCVICQRQRVKHMRCESPPLPFNRVRDALIFEIIGVDFAGPLLLKGGGKGWICIFTCAIYRAVHLELASSLSTDEFLECFRRFVARRGRPSCIYSDNGTNFAGAANALKRLDWGKVEKYGSTRKIEWLFNPPSAPWWGGWWERLVGVLKIILRKVLGKASLTYENLTTTLCDAEAIINSRPLTYISGDPGDLKPLTPSMFLQEIPEIGVPDVDMLWHDKLNKKLKTRLQIFKDLRARFRSEYLGQLVLKNTRKETREVGIGDIVLIGDDNNRRIDWPLARVVDIIAGSDGKARVFILKTKNGTLKRPIQRIYPLEISREREEVAENLRAKAKSGEYYNKHRSKTEPITCDPIKKNCDVQIGERNGVTTMRGRIIKKPTRFRD